MATSYRFGQHESWPHALIAGALGGIFFGAFMGWLIRRQNGTYREALADVPREQWRDVSRAARRPEAVADPHVRRAAYRINAFQLDRLRRSRTASMIVFSLLVVSTAWLAARETAWWLLAEPVFITLLVAQFVLPGRLERRLERLGPLPREEPA
jgi:hypothetical protein